MMRVSLDPRDALHRTVLASLPGRFVLAGHGPAEVAVVNGHHPGWVDDVARAVDGGARGVLLTRPALADPDRVRDLSAAVAGRAVVAVDTPYANDRTWTAALAEIAADAKRASLVDSTISVAGGDPATALIDQLAVVSSLVDVSGLRLVHRAESGYLAEATTTGPWLTLTGIPSPAGTSASPAGTSASPAGTSASPAGTSASPAGTSASSAGTPGSRAGLTVDVVAAERRWQVRFDGTALAVPAEVTLHDRAGAHTRPLIYESGHRAAWQRLHEAMTGTGPVGWSLDGLAGTLAVAARVLDDRKGART